MTQWSNTQLRKLSHHWSCDITHLSQWPGPGRGWAAPTWPRGQSPPSSSPPHWPHDGLWLAESLDTGLWLASGWWQSLSQQTCHWQSGGKCTSCCDKNIESLNSLCAAHSLSPDSTMSFRGSFLLKDLSLLWSSWFGVKAALLQSEFSSLLFTELCRFTFLIHGTDRQFSLKGKGMKIVYKLKSFEFFDCFECSKHYN